MEKETSRTRKSAKNLVINTGLFIFSQVMSFVSRTLFIKLLGDQYLGINGLYSNILTLLSLADLGITTAFTFALYKPLATKDYEHLASLLQYFKKVFRIVAVTVFVLGMCLVPFLQFIIKDSTLEYRQLQLYFSLSVVNSACSYLVVYKSAVFRADQKIYVVNEVDTIMAPLLHIVQIVLLYLTRNYIIYLLISIFGTLIKNIIISLLAGKSYPEIFKCKTVLPIGKEEKNSLISNLKSVFVYRLSAVIINSTDNILISVILGTVVVGYYSNYSMIVTVISTAISILINAMIASIGNLGVNATSERKSEVFHSIMLLFYGIAAFCSACFICVFNNFITVWLHDASYLLAQRDVYLIILSFFVACISNPIWMFRESCGLFKQAKYIMFIAAMLNIVLSVAGGLLLGIGGIIAATGVSRLITMFWYEPKYLYRDLFQKPYCMYWKHVTYYGVQSIIIVVLCVLINSFIEVNLGIGILQIVLKIGVCVIISAIVIILCNIKTAEYKTLYDKIHMLLKRRSKE